MDAIDIKVTDKDLAAAIREMHDTEKRLAECKRRVYELSGVIAEGEQRKAPKKTLGPKDFARACGV